MIADDEVVVFFIEIERVEVEPLRVVEVLDVVVILGWKVREFGVVNSVECE